MVRSPTNVWAFSRVSGLAQHYDGHTWRGVNLLPVSGWIDSVASLPDGQIWAVGNMVGPVVITGTPTGTSYSWNVATVPGVQSGSAGDSLTSILARSANDVWAIGGNLNIVSGHNHWFPIVAHWNGTAWTLVKVTGTFMLGGHGIADDGQGGLWLTSAWDSTGVPPYLLHFTGGKLVKVNLPPRGGRYLCIAGLARIPASTSVWGVGAWTGLGSAGPNTGVILKYGN